MSNTVSASERNIAAFDLDTAANGGYVYTSNDRWSSRYATARQSDELIRMLTGNVDPATRIVDIGCGDGTYTLDIAERFKPASIRGVDPAANAIAAAGTRIPARFTELVS